MARVGGVPAWRAGAEAVDWRCLKTPDPRPKTINHAQGKLHPRNLHRAPYDFPALTAAVPALAPWVRPHPVAGDTIDFSEPAAVLALNRALLAHHYGIRDWEIPPGYLCPPVPSRVDYLHYLADLLAEDTPNRTPPTGPSVRILDLGTGANAIYPLLAASVYGWSAVGTEIDPVAEAAARRNVSAAPALAGRIDVRRQPDPPRLFAPAVRADETFAACLCNPPFHASAEEATAGTLRKLRNLGGGRRPSAPALNFGGRAHELWCDGGEVGFIRRMIAESAQRPRQCRWFTTLVARSAHLPELELALRRSPLRPTEVRTLTMFAGQKQSRILAWSFAPRHETG